MGGAMENWGLVTFRESAVLFDPSTGSVADKKLVTMIVNHELAHQVRAMFSPHQDTCASRCVDATLNIFVHGSILNLVCCYNQLQKILRHFEQKCISRFHWMAKKKFSVKKPIATPPPSPIQCFVQDTVSLATLRRERGGSPLGEQFSFYWSYFTTTSANDCNLS